MKAGLFLPLWLVACATPQRPPVVPSTRVELERLEYAWFVDGQQPRVGPCGAEPLCVQGARLSALLDAYGFDGRADRVDAVLDSEAARQAQVERAWFRATTDEVPPIPNQIRGLRSEWLRLWARRSPEAVASAQAWTAQEPHNAHAWLALGLAWEAPSPDVVAGDLRPGWAEAERAWRRALALQPALRRAEAGLARLEAGWSGPLGWRPAGSPGPLLAAPTTARWTLRPLIGGRWRGSLAVDGAQPTRTVLEAQLAEPLPGVVVHWLRPRVPGPGYVAEVEVSSPLEVVQPAVAEALRLPGTAPAPPPTLYLEQKVPPGWPAAPPSASLPGGGP